MNYDCVIVGAGIGGLYTGIKLCEKGWRVTIIDRKTSIGTPVRCGQATGNRMELSRFVPVEQRWIAADIAGISVHINDSNVCTRPLPELGVILRRDIFEQSLALRAETLGAHLLLHTRVGGITRRGNRCHEVVVDSGERIHASMFVGADGCESSLGRWMGMVDHLPLHDSFPSVQYTIHTECHPGNFLHFFIGTYTIPHGYIWIFPRDTETVSVGAGMYGAETSAGTPRDFLDRFVARMFNDAIITETICGCIPLTLCPRRLHFENVVLVGDAARQVNPITAGGGYEHP
jgi:digeranylgeranylglycerophospholipid reductase